MQPMQVEAGATIFRAGEASAAVYVIEEGEVAITVGDSDTPTEVTRLYAGELFGESGVLEGRMRAATATAVTPTTLLVTEGETFLHAFGMDNDKALALVKLLCRRLRATTLRSTQSKNAATTGSFVVRIFPAHERLTTEFGMAPIEVRLLPFQVGNRFGGETLPIASNRNCCIPARGDLDLAAPHFEIVRRGGRLGIRDLGGRFGTTVNGALITRGSLDPFLPLHAGDNEVIAGRASSQFRFRIQYGAP